MSENWNPRSRTVAQLDADGWYVGPTEAYESPLEPGVYHIPGGAVDMPLPEVPEGKCARWDGKDWVILPDLRGTRYWLPDGSEHTIAERGIELPPGAMLKKPPPTEAQILAAQVEAAKAELKLIDAASIRALREKALGIPGAAERVQAWEAQAEPLREIVRQYIVMQETVSDGKT